LAPDLGARARPICPPAHPRAPYNRLRKTAELALRVSQEASCDGDYFSLLGEMIEDTATRYYYRLRSSDELTFVDKKSPAIHIAGQAPLTL
jgi:hypothetical protein